MGTSRIVNDDRRIAMKKDLGDRSCGTDFEADIWGGIVRIVMR